MSKGRRSIPRDTPKPPRKTLRQRQHKTLYEQRRTVKETVDIVSYVTGESRSRVNQFARKLVDDGLFPKSVGKDIKRVGPESAVLLIFAIAHATRTADASSMAVNCMNMQLRYESLDIKPNYKNKYDVEVDKMREKIGISDATSLIGILRSLLNQDDPWIPRLDIGKDSNEEPYVELNFFYPDDEPGKIRRFPLYFSKGRDVYFNAHRIYRVFEQALKDLHILMVAPDIPDDPSDFDDILDGDRERGDG